MNAVWLRLVYIFEFLVALPAIYAVWSQVGGQGHLDLMPWYLKLLLGVGAAWTIVRFSAAVIERERFWTLRSVTWFFAIVLFGAVMASTTFYYHLHEATDESDQEEGSTAAIVWLNHSV